MKEAPLLVALAALQEERQVALPRQEARSSQAGALRIRPYARAAEPRDLTITKRLRAAPFPVRRTVMLTAANKNKKGQAVSLAFRFLMLCLLEVDADACHDRGVGFLEEATVADT